MTLPQLLDLYTHAPAVQALHQAVSSGHSPIALTGLRGSAWAVMLAALSQRSARTYLCILDDEESAGYFYHDLSQLLGAERVVFFPSSYRRAVKYGQRDAANEILRTDVFARLSQRPVGSAASAIPSATTPASSAASPAMIAEAAVALATGQALCIVTHPAALAERVASREQLDAQSLTLRQGEEHDVTQLAQRLESLGFVRRDYVYEPGEFAQRGSIVDVFSYASEYPYRLDFFGDELESIRSFEVQTQLSRAQCGEVRIVPDIEANSSSDTRLVSFADLLPEDCVVSCRQLPFVADRVQAIYDEGFARQAIAECQATSEMDEAEAFARFTAEHLLLRGDTLLRGLSRFARLEVGEQRSTPAPATIAFQTQAQPLFHKNFDLVLSTFRAQAAAGTKCYVLADSEKQNERLRDIMAELQEASPEWQGASGGGKGTSPKGQSSASSSRKGAPATSLFTPVHGTLHEGFVDEQHGLALYTDHQIFDRFHKYNLRASHARNAKIALTLKELMLFEPGDFVVHVDHGVGKFAGLVRIPSSDGEMQEVIKITYHNNDAIFVSIHALHKVSKYKGKEGAPPRLSHLGTGAWERIKHKTKEKLKDIARDLILLYSRRREEQGFAYSPDSFLQHELEASFAYEDTPDQLLVTQQVKADMERPRPMDRLVCGDVGFGKTEIAVRAAFKAACDGKQVAVLVPTTVLALQHFKTFQKRLKGFPVEVDYLSRARTAAQTKELLKRLESGALNILIGTHKLIGKSVKFHDLGLLIIDEEQKFGVSVKEKLRQLKVNVDTLTMSATPIPRTLQFSLMGARDLSVINTPPPNRHPIQTEVHSFGHEIIADAINFELSRNGQVYIVTHRISSLSQIESLIHRHVPDARVVVGHGQMEPKKLEQIILDFVNHEFDVLLSTTIIENGIDVPNANTILIDNAHHFGLSDLHQMRGRVGRGGRKAFCYLMAPPLSLLPDESRRRLQAIENFSDLGSGIHIAMQDLDIRGAGNLLGAEQSGFIADLGYETYQKILAEAVAELKNDEFASLFAEELQQQSLSLTGDAFVAECNVECDLRAYLPEVYVPGASERMLLYRELDGLSTDAQIADFRRRLADRFGPLPPEAEELLRVVPLRRLGRHYGAERMVLKEGTLTLYFVANADSPFYDSAAFQHLLDFAMRTSNLHRCALRDHKGKRQLRIKEVPTVEAALQVLGSIAPIPTPS